MVATCSDLRHPTEDVRALRGPRREDLHRIQLLGREARPITQLGDPIAAPASDGPVLEQRTRMAATYSDLRHPTEHIRALRRPRREDLHRIRRVGRRAITQPALLIECPTGAPAADGPVLEQRTGMKVSCSDLCHPTEHIRALRRPRHEDLHRTRPVGRRAITQRAVPVVPPAADGPVLEQRTRITGACSDLRRRRSRAGEMEKLCGGEVAGRRRGLKYRGADR